MRLLAVSTVLLSTLACAPEGAVELPDDASGPEGRPDVEVTPGDEPTDGLPQLIVTDLQLADDDQDWLAEPGDVVHVTARLVNPTDRDHFEYPGVRLVIEPAIEPAPYDYMFYGMFGRTSAEVSFDVVLPADLSADEVVFTAEFVTLAEQGTGDAVSIAMPTHR